MRPRTKISLPNPSASEFENFDRVVGILLTKKKPPVIAKPAGKKHQERERLPRP
jgi:hypothetical protein